MSIISYYCLTSSIRYTGTYFVIFHNMKRESNLWSGSRHAIWSVDFEITRAIELFSDHMLPNPTIGFACSISDPLRIVAAVAIYVFWVVLSLPDTFSNGKISSKWSSKSYPSTTLGGHRRGDSCVTIRSLVDPFNNAKSVTENPHKRPAEHSSLRGNESERGERFKFSIRIHRSKAILRATYYNQLAHSLDGRKLSNARSYLF